MAQMEIITLKATGIWIADLIENLRLQLSGQYPRERERVSLKVFKRATTGVDLAITLLWDTGGHDSTGSLLGKRLASFLGEYGPVSHLIWEEFT